MLRETLAVMKKLRELNRNLDNNQKIQDWVDTYLDEYRMQNKPITIISPWSLSKAFEKRYEEQGFDFSPSREEISLFKKEIPRIVTLFTENGFRIEWWILFSRSYIDQRVIGKKLEQEYMSMIASVAETYQAPVVFGNWEDDILGRRHQPNSTLLETEQFDQNVDEKTFKIELDRWSAWAKESGIAITREDLVSQTRYQIACEAEEGRYLMEEVTPLCEPGKFLFMPLGRPERYTFFSTVAKDFSQRLVFVLERYPWRSYKKKSQVVDPERKRIEGGFTPLWFK